MTFSIPKQSTLQTFILVGISLGLAIWVRGIFVPFVSGDYRGALDSWTQYIVDHGGLAAFRVNFANYTPAYLYWLLIAGTLLSGLPRILAVKLLAMAVDFILAYYVFKLVGLKHPQGLAAPLAGLLILFTPTVFLNSACWGQCDSIYTTGVIACLYYLCKNRRVAALLCFGLAVSFKLQALLFAPVLIVLILKQQLQLRLLLLIPGVYLVTIWPAKLAGRPLRDLLAIYAEQAGTYKVLSNNAPNLYLWMPKDWYIPGVLIGFMVTAALLLLFLSVAWRSSAQLDPKRLVELATLFALLLPYCLPKMHDRYFFMADVLTIIFAFYSPHFFWVPLAVQYASLSAYGNFLLWDKGYSFPFYAYLNAAPIPLGITLLTLSGYLLVRFSSPEPSSFAKT